MLIDKTKPEFAHIPSTLSGEVLLEITKDANGNTTGYLTATKDVVLARKRQTATEWAKSGWDKYKDVLDGLSEQELTKVGTEKT